MNLGALYQQETDLSLQSLARTPPDAKPTAPKSSAWSAPVRGIVAGLAEVDALLTPRRDIVAEMRRPGEQPDAIEQQERDNFRARYGDRSMSQVMRDFSHSLRPDPATAGAAEQLLFDLPRLLTKAGAYGPAGMVPMAGATGFDEGATVMDDLMRKGVDEQTALKAGAVAGLATGVGIALPVAAPGSFAATAGLWALGGPGAFVAQQAATRKILADADYKQISEQYDPLDPVGLAISSLLPLPFIGLAWRGARPKAEPLRIEPTMEPQRSGAEPAPLPRERGTGPDALPPVRAEPARLTPEQADAAMVHNLTLAADVREATPVADSVAAIRSREVDAARGVTLETVQAADSLREFVAGPARDQRDNSSRIQFGEVTPAVRERILAETGIEVPVGAVQQLRADVVRHAEKGHPDLTPDDWAALGWLSENFNRAVLLKEHPNDKGPRVALAAIDPATGYAYVAEYLSGTKKGNRLSVATFFKDHPNTVESWLRTNRRGGDEGGGGGTPDDPVLPRGPQDLTSETASGAPGGIVGDAPAAKPPADPGAPGAKSEPYMESVAVRMQELEQAAPDLIVRLDENGNPVTLADEIAAARKDAAEGTENTLGADDAGLLQAAANCALGG